MANNSRGRNTQATWIIGAVIGVVIAVAAIVAISSTGGKETTSDLQQFGTIEVVGDPLPQFTSEEGDTAVGMMAPVVNGTGFSGNPISTSHGTPMLIMFFAHWCPHCQREVPLLVEWEKSGAVPAGIDVIAIATGTDPANPNYPPSDWLAREQFPALWPVMTDSKSFEAAEAYGLQGYPYFVLVGADGKVAKRMSGEIPMDQLTQEIQAVLG
ncbi:MAG: TlpA family protein disulfide reductase [Actinobacteria bacterium]|nr:TlpA family protein disulfide reductase [Actinomycetota bacterium]